MKKIFLVGVIVLMSSALTMAQSSNGQRGNSAERQQKELEQMKAELSLTAEQVTKVEALNKEMDDNMRTAIKSAGEDKEARRTAMTTMRKDRNTKLKPILTPEQYTKWEEVQKKQMEERKKNMDGKKPSDQREKSGQSQRGDGGGRGGQR